jgi:hypothetical protein
LRKLSEWTREEVRSGERFELKSVIQPEPVQLSLMDNTPLFHAKVIDEWVRRSRRLVLMPDVGYQIALSDPFVDIRWGQIWIPEGDCGILLVDKMKNLQFIIKVLSQALSPDGSEVPYIKRTRVDLESIASDHPGQWLGAIEREGNWQRGILYGNSIEEDDVVGTEYKKSLKNQIGYITSHFGSPRKARITRDGSVTVWADFSQHMDQFTQFVIDEVLPCMSPAS